MPSILVDRVNLYYEAHGQGQPLLFVHGLGSSTRDWGSQVEEFSQKYRVVTFDLRGHGRSDKPADPYSISSFAADTTGLMMVLSLDCAHVVGILLGGAVAFQLAIGCPTLILSADQDYMPVAVREAYARLIPKAQVVVIPGTHHAVPMEAPDQFNSALLHFLSNHS